MRGKVMNNRATLWVVLRCIGNSEDGVPIAVYMTSDAADNYASATEQDYIDRGILVYHCRIQCTTFYNE